MVEAIDHIVARLPFAVRAIDADNGGEFLNWHLHRYCQKHTIDFTRSRPYKKNDNAHVEQKNNTAIRKMVGYGRFDTESQQIILNQLHEGPLRLYLNFCQPTRKRKIRLIDTQSGTIKKTYFEAKTPYQWLMTMDDTVVSPTTKVMLQSQYNNLNPVKLLADIKKLPDMLDQTLG